MITKMRSMKIVMSHNKYYDSLKRRGVICWTCGDQMCSLEDAPGHVINCDECNGELRNSRKNHHHYNTPSAKLRPLRKRILKNAPNRTTPKS